MQYCLCILVFIVSSLEDPAWSSFYVSIRCLWYRYCEKILMNFSLKRGRCNEHDALASVHVLITLIPAYLLYVSQHTESAHAWLIVTPLKVASRWYFVCVIDTNMHDSAFIPYKSWGKTAQNHSGLNHSSGLDYQGWTRRDLGFWWNLRHYTNDHYGSVLRSYADK